jgi:hypothetical protein
MKLLIATLGVAVFSTALPISWGQKQRPGPCPVVVRANVEVAGDGFSLAELLAAGACAELRRAAAGVRLGRAPLAGSPRILTGDEVRALLQIATNTLEKNSMVLRSMQIPERVTIRRAGPRASCAEITARILSELAAHAFGAETGSVAVLSEPDRGSVCGVGGGIALGAPLELIRTVWNPTLSTWQVLARCIHAADCVPFLVRVPGRNSRFEKRPVISSTSAKASSSETPLVRPGEAVTLLWDQDGIRLLVPAVCLDEGAAGDAVRTRVLRGGRMVRAVVESAGRLRVAS